MPRTRKNEELPKASSKGRPRQRPKAAPEIVPTPETKQAPKVTPIRRAIRRPVVTPEAIASTPYEPPYKIYIYRISDYGIYGSHSPTKFDGEAIGEGINWADAKDWIRRTQEPSDMVGYALVERVNGHIKQTRPWQYEPVRTGPDDADLSEDGLGLLDPDEIDDGVLLDPRIVRRDIKIARLESKIEAQAGSHSNNGHGSVVDKLLERFLDERLNPPDPFAEIERVERLRNMFGGRKESNPASAPAPQRSEEEVLASAILKQPEVVENVVGSVLKRFGSKGSGDDEPWYADVVRDAVKNGQAAQVVAAVANPLGNGLGSLLSSIVSLFAPKTAQVSQPPTPVPGQHAPQAPHPQALPANNPASAPAPVTEPQAQTSQTAGAQTEQGPPLSPQDELIYTLVSACEQNTPIEQVRNFVNLSLVRHPELEDSLDQLLNLPSDQLLSLATSIHPTLAQAQHARQWLEGLTNALTSEGGAFDEVTELDKGEVKL